MIRSINRPDAVLVDLARIAGQVVVLDPLGLRPGLRVLPNPHAHLDVGPLGHLQQLGDDLRPVGRVAVVGDDHLEVHLGRLQEQGQGPGVVDVAADVGVEDHRDLRPRLALSLGRRSNARHP